jgi:parallel beta-helix repeat protein
MAIINSTRISVENVTLTKNWQAILFAYTTDSTIKNVTVASNMDAIWLIECTNCSVYGNIVEENNWGGIAIVNSYLCSVQNNNITANKEYGIFLSDSSNNKIYHNSFQNNKRQAWLYGVNHNTWDTGSLTGGNYWSDYNGVDEKSGPYQDEDGGDSIGDTPYIIDSENKDNYPLTQPQIVLSPDTTPRNIWVYAITGIGIMLIAFFTVTCLFKHRKQLSTVGKILRPEAENERKT